MTTTLKLIYENGNGAIKVAQSGKPDVVLQNVGESAELNIHHGSDQIITVEETHFAK